MFKKYIKMNQEQAQLALAVQRIASTEDGKTLFSTLKKHYMDAPLFDSDPMAMAAKVSQAELIKGLLKYVTEVDVEKIEELSVLTEYEPD